VVYVKNFPDERWGGRKKALVQAKQYRDSLLESLPPPLSRREFCDVLRSNNRSEITGVYRYAKSYQLQNGTIKKTSYWEASGPSGKANRPTRRSK
tara:strand:- start:819 stop:1103 length:285 start_codon:yes stop_codon:yes gene_type:complete